MGQGKEDYVINPRIVPLKCSWGLLLEPAHRAACRAFAHVRRPTERGCSQFKC